MNGEEERTDRKRRTEVVRNRRSDCNFCLSLELLSDVNHGKRLTHKRDESAADGLQ